MKNRAKTQTEAMSSHFQRINRDIIIGWTFIAFVLLVTYTIEVYKGYRTVGYLIAFAPVVIIPLIYVIIKYSKRPDWEQLCYYIVSGYFLMYLFVMITGRSIMVTTYILPMLALLVLYHRPRLILATGLASLAVNIISIIIKIRDGLITVANSDEVEIQVALIVLCFSGSYLATRLYNDITKQNYNYLEILNENRERLRTMSWQTITTIVSMLDARDSYTEGHSKRVSIYSTQIAKGLGMSDTEVENIRKVALLHDIGKIGVSDIILNKPGRLTDEEFALMKLHSTIGGEIIENIKTIPEVDLGVKYHHERYDGKGYPAGLKGDDIPYIARIIAVADAYDAMSSDRIYRKRLSYDTVMAELEKGTGTQFDPEIAKVMIGLLKDGTIKNLCPERKQAN